MRSGLAPVTSAQQQSSVLRPTSAAEASDQSVSSRARPKAMRSPSRGSASGSPAALQVATGRSRLKAGPPRPVSRSTAAQRGSAMSAGQGASPRCTRGAFSGSGLLRTPPVSGLLILSAMPLDARIERGDRAKASRCFPKGCTRHLARSKSSEERLRRLQHSERPSVGALRIPRNDRRKGGSENAAKS